ncbi:MAG: MEDS domain-containing protein [Gemmatimonadales bacterium]
MLSAVSEVSRHKCLIYDGHASEQLPVVVPLLEEGLRANERCLYLGDEDTIAMVRSALEARGTDVPAEMARGALVLSSERGPEDAPFDPHAMVGMLVDMIDAAVRDGFAGLCATGDMRWELGRDENFERVLEYEALLEGVFREKPLRGICQYHRSTVPPKSIEAAVRAHRSLYVGGTLNRDNLFYVPPELLLQEYRNGEQLGDWMCQQLIRIMDAEKLRDSAIDALRASESRQRSLAEELAESNRDLEHRVLERTRALHEANKELEAFAYSVSHDLRAPVRHIDGYAHILESDYGAALGEEGLAYLTRVRDSSRRMNALIEGMLAVGRVGQKGLVVQNVDLTRLATDVVAELRRNDAGRDVEIHVDQGMRAQGDETLLRATLENLLGNAWKFTGKRDRAHIEMRAGEITDGYQTFLVADNGAGFDSATSASKMFGLFQRLHRQDEFSGTGVGLATVERVIRRHGGRIWAEGARDQGAKFYFTLPVAPG